MYQDIHIVYTQVMQKYDNGSIEAISYVEVYCPISLNEDDQVNQFNTLHVYVRVNNTDSPNRVRCRLRSSKWDGTNLVTTPWRETNSDGYGNAELIIDDDHVRRLGQTMMECQMPAYTRLENYLILPRYVLTGNG